MYVMSLDLRLSHVLKMWNDLLRNYQTLLRNWVVIKVVFGFCQEACCETWSVKIEFAPLDKREISLDNSKDWINKCMAVLGLSVNL